MKLALSNYSRSLFVVLLVCLFSITVKSEENSDSSGHHMSPEMIEEFGGIREGSIAIVIYPSFTALDVFGPHHMFINLMGEKTYLVAKTKDAVPTDTGVKIQPDLTFDECPKDLLILCVPGGTSGTLNAMQDEETLAFIRDRGLEHNG